MKSVLEEVRYLHFDEIELVVVLKSLHVKKYFDKIFGKMHISSRRHARMKLWSNFKKCLKHAFMYARYVSRITKIYSLLCL